MLEKKIRKQVEWAFVNYKENKKKIKNCIIDEAERKLVASYNAMPKGKGENNSFEKGVLNAVDETWVVHKWCGIVDKTLAHFAGTGKDTLIKLKYFDKLSTWKIIDKLYIEKTTVFRWLDDVLTYAAMLALELQLISIMR